MTVETPPNPNEALFNEYDRGFYVGANNVDVICPFGLSTKAYENWMLGFKHGCDAYVKRVLS